MPDKHDVLCHPRKTFCPKLRIIHRREALGLNDALSRFDGINQNLRGLHCALFAAVMDRAHSDAELLGIRGCHGDVLEPLVSKPPLGVFLFLFCFRVLDKIEKHFLHPSLATDGHGLTRISPWIPASAGMTDAVVATQ